MLTMSRVGKRYVKLSVVCHMQLLQVRGSFAVSVLVHGTVLLIFWLSAGTRMKSRIKSESHLLDQEMNLELFRDLNIHSTKY